MALDAENGKKMLQLLTSRYNDRHWRKKIEKTLSLSPTGVAEDVQRSIFLYLKHGLKAYKSRRADPDSWIVGGFATTEVIQRAKFSPTVVGPHVTKEDVAYLATDPGPEVDEGWWEEMLVMWFEAPESEESEESGDAEKTDISGDASDRPKAAPDTGTGV
jgi:hypothetical protein